MAAQGLRADVCRSMHMQVLPNAALSYCAYEAFKAALAVD